KTGGGVERHAERRDMGAQRIIRRNGFRDEIRPLRLYARIDMLAVIAVRPSVESAVLYRGHVIGHEVGSDLVPFVDDGPERAALWLEGQAVGIAQPAGEDAKAPGSTIDLQDVGAI